MATTQNNIFPNDISVGSMERRGNSRLSPVQQLLFPEGRLTSLLPWIPASNIDHHIGNISDSFDEIGDDISDNEGLPHFIPSGEDFDEPVRLHGARCAIHTVKLDRIAADERATYRANERAQVIEGMTNRLERRLLWANPGVAIASNAYRDTGGLRGLLARLSQGGKYVNPLTGIDSVMSAGGAGDTLQSVLFCTPGPKTLTLLYNPQYKPNADAAATTAVNRHANGFWEIRLKGTPLVDDVKYDAARSGRPTGKQLRAYVTDYEWTCGIAMPNPYVNGRLANVAQDLAPDVFYRYLMYFTNMMPRKPATGSHSQFILMSRQLRNKLAMAERSQNLGLFISLTESRAASMGEYFNGIRLHTSDYLGPVETAIKATKIPDTF